jgi:hypothetical protein
MQSSTLGGTLCYHVCTRAIYWQTTRASQRVITIVMNVEMASTTSIQRMCMYMHTNLILYIYIYTLLCDGAIYSKRDLRNSALTSKEALHKSSTNELQYKLGKHCPSHMAMIEMMFTGTCAHWLNVSTHLCASKVTCMVLYSTMVSSSEAEATRAPSYLQIAIN